MNDQQARRVAEARAVLSQLGFPKAQTGDRSALVLLALLDLPPDRAWEHANGYTMWRTYELMDWMAGHYGKRYAPNSRETIRRQTLHQFVAAGLALHNPDDPGRPVNSGDNCYQIAPEALELLQAHDDEAFEVLLDRYLVDRPGLQTQYSRARAMLTLPVTMPDGSPVELTAGGQNVLIKDMIEQFCPRWTPGGQILYVGDAGKQDPVFDVAGFAALGVVLDKHGKLPDLVVYLSDRDWLVLMEAASSHGPVDAKRHAELAQLFAASSAGLVYVSCFPSRTEMRKYLADIAWETEVWCADAPDHLVHFNGERFLGPYS